MKSEDMRSIMDSLSFIMVICLGTKNRILLCCGLAGEAASEDPVSCLNGSAQIVFEPEEFVYDDTSNQWIYKIVPLT